MEGGCWDWLTYSLWLFFDNEIKLAQNHFKSQINKIKFTASAVALSHLTVYCIQTLQDCEVGEANKTPTSHKTYLHPGQGFC